MATTAPSGPVDETSRLELLQPRVEGHRWAMDQRFDPQPAPPVR